MQNFGIRFLICSFVILILTGLLLMGKHLLRKQLSPGLQYYLCLPFFVLLLIPFLPFSIPGAKTGFLLFQKISGFFHQISTRDSEILSPESARAFEGFGSGFRDFAVSTASPASSFWNYALLLILISGAAVMLVLLFCSALRLGRISRSSRPLSDPKIRKILDTCRTELGIRRPIPVYVTCDLTSPVTTGFLRPRIFLPLCRISDLNPKELHCVLLHELQHCRHMDGLINLLCSLFRILYWFHPAVLFMLKKIGLERELACDASVMEHLSEKDYYLYGSVLLSLAEKTAFSPFASGIGGSKSQLRHRILGITSYRPRSRKQKRKSALLYLLIFILFSGSFPLLSAYAAPGEAYSSDYCGKNVVSLDHSADFKDFKGSFVLYDSSENTWQIYNRANARKRVSPASTYKIYAALHGLEEGVITAENSSMKWNGDACPFSQWEKDQTLSSAMKLSVNWYFQNIDLTLGRASTARFLKKTGYGNQKIGRDLKLYWTDDSLKISALEQIELLQKFHDNEFGFKEENIQAVKTAMNSGPLGEGTLYGKTGTSRIDGKDVSGWFVGFLETENTTLYFAANLQDQDHADGSLAAQFTTRFLEKYSSRTAASF